MTDLRAEVAYDSGSQTETVADRAYRAIKHEIISCELPPGAVVNEGSLAQRLEMSKTPVREALSRLVHEGWLKVEPRHGYRVSEISVADVQEIFAMRLLLEPAAAALIAERGDVRLLNQLRELSETATHIDEAGGYARLVDESMAFHFAFASAAGNRRLGAILTRLFEEALRLRHARLDLTEAVRAHDGEHRDLVDALVKGNGRLAEEIAARQVEASRKWVLEALLKEMSIEAGGRVLTLHPIAREAVS
jgi:DNA-binding GntR family transcriptional regulator